MIAGIAAAETSSRPTPALAEEEARTLWESGNSAFQKAQFPSALFYLQRLVARYPSDPNHLGAYSLIGQAFLKTHEDEKAGEAFKYVIHATPEAPVSYEARIHLAESYLNLKKWKEASVVTTEIEGAKPKNPLPPEILLKSLLIRAKSAFAQDRTEQALRALDSLLTQTQVHTQLEFSQIRSRALALQLEMNLLNCKLEPFAWSTYKSQGGALDETKIRHHFNGKGLCLMENLNLLREIISLEDPATMESAASRFGQSFRAYLNPCFKPDLWLQPKQPRKEPQKMSKEFSRFTEELGQLLAKDCSKDSTTALQNIQSWKEAPRGALNKSVSPLFLSIVHKLSQDLEHSPQGAP